MKFFKPTTPEEVYDFMGATDEFVDRINETVKDLLSLSYNDPVTHFSGFKDSKGCVMIMADVDEVHDGFITFPARFLFQDAKTNRKEWEQLEKERIAREKARKAELEKERLAQQEAFERSEYERLKAKYGDNNA